MDHRLSLRGELPVFARAEVSRDFIHVDDVVEAFADTAILMGPELAGESINIGSGQPTTLAALAELATAGGVKSTRVSVETNDGVVTLTGVLPTQTAVQKAETVARAVKGVKKVDAAGLKVKG